MTNHKTRGRLIKTAAAAATFFALILSGCSGGGGEGGTAGSEKPFYEGKTINIIVPTDAGGTVDTTARFLAVYLNKYVEGSPTVVIENITGGNQIVGANEFTRRSHDGTELFINGNGTTLYQLLGNEAALFDYNEYAPLIAFGGNALVCSNKQSGITTGSDLIKSTGAIYGGVSASGTDLSNVVAFELLGLDYQPVIGYESNTSKRLAFLQGEMDLSSDSTVVFLREMAQEKENGDIFHIFSYGPMNPDGTLGRDPLVPDVPNVHDLYQEKYGSLPAEDDVVNKAYMAIIAARSLANVLWVWNDAPEEAQSALLAAVDKMVVDPEFIAGLDAAVGGNEPILAEDIGVFLEPVLNPDTEVVDWIKDFLLTKFDTKI